MTGSSTQGLETVPRPASDPATAHGVYSAPLGAPPPTDGSDDIGFAAAGQHIGPVPGGGPRGMASPVADRHVPDLEANVAQATAAGGAAKEPAHDAGGGRLLATAADPDGTVLGPLRDR